MTHVLALQTLPTESARPDSPLRTGGSQPPDSTHHSPWSVYSCMHPWQLVCEITG